MAPVSQLKLYTNPRTRGSFVEWYLKELGVQYETVPVDLSNKEHKADWYTKVNPLGKVPALQDGDLKLAPTNAENMNALAQCQSGAMLLYLADKYDALVKTPEDRARCAQWVLFANTDLVELAFKKNLPEGSVEGVVGHLDARLAAHPFVAGEDFTVGDVAVSSYLLFFKVFLPQVDLAKWPSVSAYLKRISARPACEATVVSAVNLHLGK